MFKRVDWPRGGAHRLPDHGITPEVAEEGLRDPGRVVIDPDYNSRSGQSVRIIGFSTMADAIITVIVVVAGGAEYGANGWVSNSKIGASTTRAVTTQRKGKPMNEKIEDLITSEARAAEEAELTSDPDTPLPTHVKVTRGHPRARNLQVRFRDDELDQLRAYAEQRGLPVSTVVRSLVLQAISPADDLEAALDKLETDLVAVRRRALSVESSREDEQL